MTKAFCNSKILEVYVLSILPFKVGQLQRLKKSNCYKMFQWITIIFKVNKDS